VISMRYELRLRTHLSVEHIKQRSTIRSAHESFLCCTEEESPAGRVCGIAPG